MARYDKYDPMSGGFRAPLNADLVATEDQGTGNPLMVSINSSGKVVVGATAVGDVRGVLCTTRNMKANEIVDVMTDGEIVEMAGVALGAVITGLNTTGVIDDLAPDATHFRLGFMVEGPPRFIVRVSQGAP